jgi:hypothetical protein
MISSKNEGVINHDLGGLTLQITCDACWASWNVGLKHSTTWNDSRCVPLWRFYLFGGIEVTSSLEII